MYPRRTVLAALLPTLFIASAANAQQQLALLDPVVVTATRQAQRVDESIATVTVLEQAELDAAGPSTTLGELLGRLPGIELGRSGGRGSDESIFIRGANGGHTLFLVDGMRVGSATLGSTSAQLIPLSQISRVEVLRGPASAVYGSDAIGGVIQVFTKAGAEAPLFSAEAGAGNLGTYAASVAHANRIGGLSYDVKLGGSTSIGINSILSPAYPGYNPDRDGYKNQNASLNAAYAFNKAFEVGAGYFYSESRNRYDAFQSQPVFPWASVNAGINYQMQHQVSGGHAYARLTPLDGWVSNLKVAQGMDRTESPEAVLGDPRSLFKTTQNQVAWQNDLRLPVGNAMVLLERLEQTVDSTKNYSQKSRTIDSVGLGWNGRFGSNSFQVNFRSDDNSQFGRHNTYLLGYAYRFTPAWSLAASYGTAFKAPTMNDLYFPTTPGVGGGNANLKPEESRSRELSLRYETDRYHGSITYFDNRIENLIDWVTDPVTFFSTPDNTGKVRIKGVELVAGTVVGAWRFNAAVTFQDPRDEETNEQLRRRARQYATLSAIYGAGPVNAGVELKGVGRRYDDPHWQTRLNQVEMGGYALVNLFADYRFSRAWQAFARVDNLFDQRYETARSTTVRYGVPGVTAFAGLRYSFQ